MKDKKPFWQTRIGKIVKGGVREIPFVGGTIDNVNSEDSGKGKIDKDSLIGQIVVGGVVLLIILQSFGVISISSDLLQSLIDLF